MQLIRFKKTLQQTVCNDTPSWNESAGTRLSQVPMSQTSPNVSRKVLPRSCGLMSWGMWLFPEATSLAALSSTLIIVGVLNLVSLPGLSAPSPSLSHNLDRSTAIPDPLQLAQTIPLNLEGRHPDDIAVRVQGIRFVENSIVLNLEIVNGSDIAIHLNSGDPQQGMVLRDDVGNRYNLVTPERNSSIGLLAGETLTEEFTFTGPVSSSATSLTLITNDQAGQTDVVPTIVPKIVISGIPVK